MNKVEVVYSLLEKVVSELNRQAVVITLNQQVKTKKHMSLSGANGRLWISPSQYGYDVSLSGLSLEKQLEPTLTSYFGRECDGYKQLNGNKGFKRQPFWRTDNFRDVEVVCEMYAKTGK
ncbi:hypothetical protein [Agarivorans gilvus]|uniref:Histidine kinase n=1 Tax=Agarivorans gilvus TaxID=680279 RepID=A0ABQ1I0X5_9ALTE|nr:hypothetical protein [Agarivorans gilvus]GGB01009.1 hypothetical protein GCM10007414_12700 [Agarivorans gilvus]